MHYAYCWHVITILIPLLEYAECLSRALDIRRPLFILTVSFLFSHCYGFTTCAQK